jgi:preprotein translocase subunit SecB
MAEQEGFMDVGGQPENGADTAPQVGMISQYVKDLSFENPNAPAVYQWQTQPQIEVQFNIGTQKLGDEVFEVALKIEVLARADENTAFAVDLLYAGLFAIRSLPEEQLQPFLLAEAPRLLFPFARRVVRIPIRANGSAGEAEPFVERIERLPDGLAFDADGTLYISCYEPSRLYRASPAGELELLYDDPEAHMLCHPTNCAFRGTDLFTSNLGRWHITKIDVGIPGASLL